MTDAAGKTKPPRGLVCTPEVRNAARKECAARATNPDLAKSYLEGGQDQGWAMRHTTDRMMQERNP